MPAASTRTGCAGGRTAGLRVNTATDEEEVSILDAIQVGDTLVDPRTGNRYVLHLISPCASEEQRCSLRNPDTRGFILCSIEALSRFEHRPQKRKLNRHRVGAPHAIHASQERDATPHRSAGQQDDGAQGSSASQLAQSTSASRGESDTPRRNASPARGAPHGNNASPVRGAPHADYASPRVDDPQRRHASQRCGDTPSVGASPKPYDTPKKDASPIQSVYLAAPFAPYLIPCIDCRVEHVFDWNGRHKLRCPSCSGETRRGAGDTQRACASHSASAPQTTQASHPTSDPHDNNASPRCDVTPTSDASPPPSAPPTERASHCQRDTHTKCAPHRSVDDHALRASHPFSDSQQGDAGHRWNDAQENRASHGTHDTPEAGASHRSVDDQAPRASQAPSAPHLSNADPWAEAEAHARAQIAKHNRPRELTDYTAEELGRLVDPEHYPWEPGRPVWVLLHPDYRGRAREAFLERAAIMEYDAELPRAIAEYLAYRLLERRIQKAGLIR